MASVGFHWSRGPRSLRTGEIARAEVRFKETNGVFGLDGNLELLSKGSGDFLGLAVH